MKPTNRRQFVKDISLTSISLLSIPMFFGSCEDVFDQIKNRPVRRCIRDNDLVNEQLEIYKKAVSAMKSLPTSDARNWTRQAEIHQNFCPHGNWFFFPWHRVYLYYFEEICRTLSGESSFGLPFWDWSIHPRIPSQFWGTSNPLYNSTRWATPSSVASPTSVGYPLVDGFCNEPNFNVFAGGQTAGLRTPGGSYGNIEGTPHNYIHGFVGGDMATFMSPLDPVFWSHHCMVDVCWYEWNVLRGNPNTNDSNWLNFNYSGMFVDGSGSPASMTTLQSIILPLFNYRYETGIDCNPNSTGNKLMANSNKDDFNKMKLALQKGAPVDVDVKQRFNVSESMLISTAKEKTSSLNTSAVSFSRAITGDEKERVILFLDGVKEPTEIDLFLRVFINKKDANAKTSPEDPHYAGSYFFFRHSKNFEAKKVNFMVDITQTLRRLKGMGDLNNEEDLSITLVAVPINEDDTTNASISVESININISEISVDKLKF